MNFEDDTLDNRNPADEVKTANLSGILAEELLERDFSNFPRPINFWRIAMTIVEFDIQLIINLSGPVMLGRNGTATDDYNYIDLSPYKAHHHGVSRKHALLTFLEDKVVIQDCGSSNGVLLNSKSLKSMVFYPLQKGDRIELGKLKLRFSMLYDPFSGGKQSSVKR